MVGAGVGVGGGVARVSGEAGEVGRRQGGGRDYKGVAAGEGGEGRLAFGERFEEQEARGRKVFFRAKRPRAVGGADVDPRADVDAAGGGAGEQAVHFEGAVAAREVETERVEQAVGGVPHAGFEAFGHGGGAGGTGAGTRTGTSVPRRGWSERSPYLPSRTIFLRT